MNSDTFTTIEEANKPPKTVIEHPKRAMSRIIWGPVFYLAHKMARSDNETLRKEIRIVDELAKAAGLSDYRNHEWYSRLTEKKALEALQGVEGQRCLMVVLTLVLKADGNKRPEEHQYFRSIREKLGAPPIRVPVNFYDHKRLAMEYAQPRRHEKEDSPRTLR